VLVAADDAYAQHPMTMASDRLCAARAPGPRTALGVHCYHAEPLNGARPAGANLQAPVKPSTQAQRIIVDLA